MAHVRPLHGILLLLTWLALGAGPACDRDPDPQDDDSAVSPDDDDTGDDDSGADDDDTVLFDEADIASDLLPFLPPCAGSILETLEPGLIDAPGPDSDGYVVPDAEALDGLRESMAAAFAWDADTAMAALATSGYQVCRGTGDEIGLVAWLPLETGLGEPRIVWRFLDAEPLVLGVPHALYELGTLGQGVDLFDGIAARALVVTGTHRCANNGSSACEGETSVCAGVDEAFRESDMAHTVDSLYHVAHEALLAAWPGDWVVSVHGMDADGVSVSDGLTGAAEDDAAVAMLGTALMAEFSEETVTSCNGFSGAVVDERYCGEFDVQGRLVNGAGFPCFVAPASASGTFLHLEQSILVRAQPDRVVDAFRTVFP